MTHLVFISYSQKDTAVAHTVCSILEQDHIPCWIAPRDIPTGQDWASAITQAIRTAKCFVLIFSEKANASDHVHREVQLAVDNQVPVLPFRIEDFQLSPKLQYYLSSVQWLKAYPPPTEGYLPQLLQTARQALGLPEIIAAPPAPLPLAIPAAAKNNLPPQLTSFIGREIEIAQVEELLTQHRLVTLTGVGGTGKTRLSLQVAAGLLDAFPDGVRLVELAPLADPALLLQTVISALGQVEQPGKTPLAFLEDYLRPKHLLLILDNCEHLVEASAALAAALLHCAPRLSILASSREILGVAGEVPFRVPPLGMPDPRQLPPLADLARFDAVRLFVARAQVVEPSFTLTQDNAPAVAQIIQRLDGIPLAIELAAARLRMLSAAQIALRLNDAFRLLTGGARTALPRHQTLQALIDWSYNLLSEAERQLLRSLSVFAGGWTLEAAEEVGGGSPDVLDLLSQLADKSLIMAVQTPGGEMRYRMLETIRQYAHTRLIDAGEAAAVRTRHLVYYLHLAETLEPRLAGREQIPTLDYWETELDNLCLALEWALQADIEAELRLSASLEWFWRIRRFKEGISWLEQGLAAEALGRGDLPTAGSRTLFHAKALTALGGQLTSLGGQLQSEKGMLLLEEALALYRGSGLENRQGVACALMWLSFCKLGVNERAQAKTFAEEALSLFRECDDHFGMVDSLDGLGACEIDPEKKKKIFMEALAISQANGGFEYIATDFSNVGDTDLVEGNYEDAFTSFVASRENYQQVGNLGPVATSDFLLAFTSFLTGDLERADLHLDEALAGFRELAGDVEVAWCLFLKSQFAFTQGRYEQVAEFNEEVVHIAQKTGDPEIFTNVLYHRARLARLRGDTAEARRCAEEGLNAGRNTRRKVLVLLELGHLALQDGDLSQADALLSEGLQVLIHWRAMVDMNMILDGLAVLAVREGRLERAARLFGTRQWRGWAHTLSPIELTERDADFTAISHALGAERFAQLQAEGLAMPFMQILALAQE